MPLEDLHEQSIDNINYLVMVGQGRSEAILSYNQILDHLEQEHQQDNLYKFRAIAGHQSPLTKDDENYKGSAYNVMIEWEITQEPALSLIADDDPMTCAVYAKKHLEEV